MAATVGDQLLDHALTSKVEVAIDCLDVAHPPTTTSVLDNRHQWLALRNPELSFCYPPFHLITGGPGSLIRVTALTGWIAPPDRSAGIHTLRAPARVAVIVFCVGGHPQQLDRIGWRLFLR